ncbi:MAG: stage II sporulation protein M [Bacteroidota bacterium]|nr:stage II sporulation protein M [Bacteroidota bacterium]
MKEITFLKQNAEKWEKMEAALNEGKLSNPREVSDMFIELTNDLSYSRTYYPQSTTTQYLNALTAKTHQAIYLNKKEEKGRFKRFWKFEIPGLFGQYHKQLFIAFIVFTISAVIGFVSQVYDDDFIRLIVGDQYVNETIERIKAGNGLGIYGTSSEGVMFIGITSNNIFVSFRVFALGMIFSLGAGYELFRNGVMLGAFHAMFYKYNLLVKSLLVVYIHGTLEISAIIIAGCAGFILGNSFMFPGTYTRMESFKRGAKDSLKIVVGLVPVFIMAGFLESFVTRYTNMPLWLSLFIILSSLTFIIWYFIIYPIRLTKKTNYVSATLP